MPGKVSKSVGHETDTEPSSQEPPVPTYSTRNAKRKATEMSSSQEPSPPRRSSIKNLTANQDTEDSARPAKKTRRSKSSEEEKPTSPFITVNNLPTPQELEEPEDTPEDILEVATAGDTDREISPAESVEAVTVRPWNPAANLRGSRGRGRGGRGGRGRGRGGPRGGRGGWKRGGGPVAGPRGANVADAPRGRGKHGRVKTSSDARIQALYNRKYALKQQFKIVAGFQREALEALGDKALELLEDPNYHKSLPEYEIVTQELADKHEKANLMIEAKFKMEKDQAEREYFQNSDYDKQLFENKVSNTNDIYEKKLQAQFLYVIRQHELGRTCDSTPFYRGMPGEVVKHIDSGLSKSNSAWQEPPVVDGQKKKLGRKPKNPSPSKPKVQEDAPVRIKSSLFSTAGSKPDLGVNGDDASQAPTPAGGSESEGEETDSEDLPTDAYGVHVPNKKAPRNGDPPNNRFVQDPNITFDDNEIGVRHHFHKKNNKGEALYVGMDTNPNPRKFHFDQFARGHNSAHNQPGDLNEKLVEQHGVHPEYGLPIPGSKNPDRDELQDPVYPPPTKWTEPLPVPTPTVFIRKNPDGSEEASHTSRSAWIMNVQREWDTLDDEAEERKEHRQVQAKMSSLLAIIDPPAVVPITPIPKVATPEPEVEDVGIDLNLLRAVNQAPPPTSVTPQRSQGYDPARDMFFPMEYPVAKPKPYTTPYQGVINPQLASRHSLQALAEAAGIMDKAEGFGTKLPPRKFSPVESVAPRRYISHYAQHSPVPRQQQFPPLPAQMQYSMPPPPPPPPQPQQPQPQMFHPVQHLSPYSPQRIQGDQYSPQRNLNNVPGGFRELRPAPPQARKQPPVPAPSVPAYFGGGSYPSDHRYPSKPPGDSRYQQQ